MIKFRKALLLLALTIYSQPAFAERPGLEIFFVDVEGGAATLLVGPLGDSLLVDSGNPGARDAERIHQAAKAAGLAKIDHLATTHWHADHYGGVKALAKLIPIERFYDRGIPEKLAEDPQYFPFLIGAYKEAAEGKRTELKPGDKISLRQPASGPALEITCLTSARRTLKADESAPLNACCGANQPKANDASDNAMSLSLLVRYGDFKFLDCGDLTWNVEYDLVCPRDPIGKVDVFQVTHHGLDISNNPTLVDTVSPRVAIFNNGARKGAAPAVMKTLRQLPDLQAVYQLHRNLGVGDDLNTDPTLIANEAAECKGEYIHLTVAADAKSYTVQVGAAGLKRTYQTRTP